MKKLSLNFFLKKSKKNLENFNNFYFKLLCFSKVTTGFGHLIKLNVWSWGDTTYWWGFEIVPSKADFGKSTGLFGNFDGNYYDDLIYLRDGKTIASSLDAYLDSFK